MDVADKSWGDLRMKRILFLGIEGCLYILFLWMDFTGMGTGEISNKIKYISIFVCFFYIITQREGRYRTRDGTVVKLAIFFTLVSDTFLLMLGKYELGVTSFIVVQLLYWCRLQEEKNCNVFWQILVAIFIIVALYFAGIMINYLLVVSVSYFVLIVMNTGYALLQSKNLLFVLGMVLFLLCDINVACYNLTAYIELPRDLYENIYAISSKLIWLFYLPSQVCLVFSVETMA